MNGKKFEGSVVKIKECQVEFKIDNVKYTIPAADIFAIKFENEESKVYKKYLNAPNRDVNKCLAVSTRATTTLKFQEKVHVICYRDSQRLLLILY